MVSEKVRGLPSLRGESTGVNPHIQESLNMLRERHLAFFAERVDADWCLGMWIQVSPWSSSCRELEAVFIGITPDLF